MNSDWVSPAHKHWPYTAWRLNKTFPSAETAPFLTRGCISAFISIECNTCEINWQYKIQLQRHSYSSTINNNNNCKKLHHQTDLKYNYKGCLCIISYVFHWSLKQTVPPQTHALGWANVVTSDPTLQFCWCC